MENLRKENITRNVWNVGDVMYDAILYNKELAQRQSTILADLSLAEQSYYLITIHRAENTDDPDKLKAILAAFADIDGTKVWPIHPRTRHKLEEYGLDASAIPGLRLIDPVGYLDMLRLESGAKKIITDSGGVQKEAYFLRVPCVTVREQTEWVETLKGGANILTGTDREKIVAAVHKEVAPVYADVFGDGHAAEKIVAAIGQR